MPGSPTEDSGALTVAPDDYLWFVDRALDPMVQIVVDLGDELANRQPDLPDANSAYAILTHCLGVMEYWAGGTVAERAFERDRRAEFVATGRVEELAARARAARTRLGEDIAGFDASAPPANVFPDPAHPIPYDLNKGAVLVHILEELYQHLGQMELTRDLLVAGS
jgi:DinB superfamily